MSEYIVEVDALQQVVTVMLLHRFISRVHDALGVRDDDIELISGSGQCDMGRLALVWLGTCPRCQAETQVNFDDPFVNPFRRIKNWRIVEGIPDSEIHVEHPKGRCRIKNLPLYG